VTRVPVAVIHGRFQPLHLGHLEYLLAGARACNVLVVGITNPDPDQVEFEPSDPGRGTPQANPFTFYERYLMVEGALRDAGIAPEALRIVPFPHGAPERLHQYAPREALHLLTIYDEWGAVKQRRFEDLGCPVHVLWRRKEKVTSGSEVRRRIREGEPWDHLVPAAVASIVRRPEIQERLRAVHR
jgi:nicotinamide-nucleotide adenylyltransferase/phosphinothricin biosynthesis protein PhpF